MDFQHHTNSTSISGSSSPSSKRGIQECYHDFFQDKKSKRSKQNCYRSGSIVLGSVKEVSEDIEDYLIQRIPHIQIQNDKFEFRQNISQRDRSSPLLIRKQEYKKRRASLSPHGTNGLQKVEEVNGDDDELKNKCIFKLGLIFDKNEFNDKQKRSSIVKERTNHDPNLSILEDVQENVKDQHTYANTILKLKVDEVDFGQDKKQWAPEEMIEIIEEEKPDTIINVKEKEMFQKIKKILHEERDFLKKILKGEMIEQEDIKKKQEYQMQIGEAHWNQLIQEAEEQVNSDEDHQ
ncbi:unnamed protein product [Paramecium pentaurelia]|uniref:Uncharacterized protein n=1 Tax=Paramecium pentaurelia TaxID=43138 RepID=A0A8S1WTU5_9CILI|nr:unnamed protein product [Paramecium pentaurelia]